MNTEDDEFARIAREQALNKMADNARELGLDYEPAQQEPVKHELQCICGCSWEIDADGNEELVSSPPAQRTWVGLTDKEEVELWESTDSDWELMKRTEAKLKEKNT